jgi:hypothetical protein
MDAGQGGRVNDLKREIAIERYEVDAGAVAAAIISKLGRIRYAREALQLPQGGRSRESPPGSPRDH